MKNHSDTVGGSFGIVNSNRDIDMMIAKSKQGMNIFRRFRDELGERANPTPKGYKRCPGCGGMVKLPCIYCEATNALNGS